ncbi:MAG: hypothetical protein M0P72_01505 [Metallibacterium scheffleri]|uniref:hypothetical protein n=1 Tax=Metallibacterium scheffleri TaxID=993689 RepID=UPI0026F203B5|nr:hypothetical protein [Metallibacterium scheffleri]MCK9365813.1 hypothetical protein [Metallibacterium scheffleri]
MDFNLWAPGHLDVGAALITALLLGVVHGITPDEHTWPITFSYAVGGYSTRAGLRAGALFSFSFIVQRALASELAWLGLAHWMGLKGLDYALYIPVGLLMLFGGMLMARQRHAVHLHLFGHCDEPALMQAADASLRGHGTRDTRARKLAGWMPAVHGFVAGWGFGAFALILYTTLAPAMPSAWWGWVPGALFGLGTALVQVLAGALFGRIAARRSLPPEVIRAVALTTATRTLIWGGLAYASAGALGLLLPRLREFGIVTGLHVHNLDHLGVPFMLAVGVVLGVGLTTLITETRHWQQRLRSATAAPVMAPGATKE